MTDQRTQAKIVSLLAQGFSRSTEIRSTRDLSFVVSRLEGEDQDMAPCLAVMLEDGLLRRALTTASENPEDCGVPGGRGTKIAESTRRYASLREDQLWDLLLVWEPDVAPRFQEATEDIAKSELSELVTFALGHSLKAKLPEGVPDLRYSRLLGEYTKVRYIALGRRLQFLDAVNNPRPGYFHLDLANRRVYLTPGAVTADESSPYVDFPQLASGVDWKIVHGTSHAAVLESETECETIKLVEKFRKMGHAVPPERDDWEMPESSWPQWVRRPAPLTEDTVAPLPVTGTSSSTPSAPVTPSPPELGGGRVVPPKRRRS